MEYTNKNMKRLKERLEDRSNANKVDLSKLKDIISPNIVKVDDCYILDLEYELTDNTTINWNRILKMYGDKTGYEASCNELRINDYLDNSDLSDEEISLYAFQVVDGWEQHLKEKFPEHKFVVIISIDEGFATLRFHKYREEESGWLKADIEDYGNEAILVKEINFSNKI
ncbi:hypothetical protein ACPZJV_06570 [Bacillus velezensis]|uniref:hypothetical protein n=1 Tax=Bacillus TaxID=1386 RepID=UPI00044D34EB|nr:MULTISPECIES: hypothetical protein [Bacillus amyloliquefaciens group]AXY39430.1 hypothetical protein D3C60_17455 [Bacillus velezensis]EYB35771.1 hypothetical protein AW26_0113660 [Bacillus amyloliquefaciens EBL11]MEC0931024.1 hypothetical protein [Bacillus velezensis]MEC0973071.1 hypothetical protein [Bacillus velezensis]NYZ56697.1 hypothetical protein [Bacillus amyloliquefaciens]